MKVFFPGCITPASPAYKALLPDDPEAGSSVPVVGITLLPLGSNVSIQTHWLRDIFP